MSPRPPSVVIEAVTPLVDGGRYPIKRCVGEDTVVEADIYKDGHDILSAVLKWRMAGSTRWHEAPMIPIPKAQDRWQGTFSVFENSIYEYTVEAWGDFFKTWQHEFAAKFTASQPDLQSETLEGAQFMERSAALAAAAGRKHDAERLGAWAKTGAGCCAGRGACPAARA